MDEKKKKIIRNAGFAAFYAVWGILLYQIFLRQAIQYPGRLGNYPSDLGSHISEGRAGVGYSLMEMAFGFLMEDLRFSERSVGLLLALTVLATLWVTYRVMRSLYPEGNAMVLHLLAIAGMFVMPIYCKALNPNRYLGLQSATIWHNSTYTGMKLAGMCVLFFYFYYQENYQKEFNALDFVWFTIVLAFANLIKPNFIVAFAPAMAVMLLTDCIHSRGKKIGSQILFGIPVLISLWVLVRQSTKLFGAGDVGSSISVSIAYILRLRATHPVLSLLQSAAFPLIVLAANFRDLKTDRRFRVTWLIWLFGLLEFLFLNENGDRRDHGNLTWGYSFCLFLVFIVCLCWLYRNIREWYGQYKASESRTLTAYLRESRGGRGKLAYFAIALIAFCAHLFCGLQYFAIIWQGGSYF